MKIACIRCAFEKQNVPKSRVDKVARQHARQKNHIVSVYDNAGTCLYDVDQYLGRIGKSQ